MLEGLVEHSRARVVQGQVAVRAGALRAAGGEHGHEGAVQVARLVGQQRRVEHVGEQRVPEPHQAGVVLLGDAGGRRLVHRVVHPRPAGYIGEHPRVHRTARDGQHLGDRARPRGQVVRTGRAARAAARPGCPRAATPARGRRRGPAGGQVGVAERALPDVLDQGVPRGRAPQVGELLGGLLDGQPGQRQVDHAGHPQHVGQPAVQDMSVGDALVAVGDQQRHRLLPGPGDEVGERVEGADVGPLKVVDGEDDGAFLGEPGHRAVDRVQGAAGGVGSPVDAVQRGQVEALHRVPLGAPALERAR